MVWAGAGLILAGFALVFVAWRGRAARRAGRRGRLAAGWLLGAVGTGLWACAGGLDIGLGQAVTAGMVAALACVGLNSLTLAPSRKAARQMSLAPTGARKSRISLKAAGILGGLLLATVFGLLVGLVAVRWAPTDPATRLMTAALIAMAGAAAGLVFLLASARPWRAAGLLAAVSVLAALVLGLAGKVVA